jgi:bacteriocin biosynthesis cyclodehydratase domain-containing protein
MSRIGQKLVVHSSVSIACISPGEVSIRTAASSFTVEDPTGELLALLELYRHPQAGLPATPLAKRWASFLIDEGILVAVSHKPRDRFLDQVDFIRARREQAGDYVAPGTRIHDGAPIEVSGSGALAAAVRSAIRGLGYSSERSRGAAFEQPVICCSDWDDREFFLTENAGAIRSDRIFIPAAVEQRGIRIGPVVIPGESACFGCFHARNLANLRYPDEEKAHARDWGARFQGDASRPAVSVEIGARVTASILAKVAAGLDDLALVGEVLFFDPLLLTFDVAPVLRLPRCAICGGSPRPSVPANGGTW